MPLHHNRATGVNEAILAMSAWQRKQHNLVLSTMHMQSSPLSALAGCNSGNMSHS